MEIWSEFHANHKLHRKRIAVPVLTTSLYFIVFGKAIGSRMGDVDHIS